MRQFTLKSLAVAAVAAGVCRAEEVPPPIPLPVPEYKFQPLAPVEAEPASPRVRVVQPVPGGSKETTDRSQRAVEHLLRAAEHLDAAGRIEDASSLRNDARLQAIKDNLLARKESELECLQEEIERLRELTGQAHSLIVSIAALEIDRSKLGNRASELDRLLGMRAADPYGHSAVATAGFEEAAPQTAPFQILDANPLQHPLIKRLRESGAIAILTQPTLMTGSGRPASFLQGGQFAVSSKAGDGGTTVVYKPFGTQLEIVPVSLPGQRIRLQARLELSERRFDPEGPATVPPALVSRAINTQVELKSGQTVVMGSALTGAPGEASTVVHAPERIAGALQQASHEAAPEAGQRQFVLLLTASLAVPDDAPQPLKHMPGATRELQQTLPDGSTEPLQRIQPVPEPVPSAYHPQDEMRYHPAVPVLPRGLRR